MGATGADAVSAPSAGHVVVADAQPMFRAGACAVARLAGFRHGAPGIADAASLLAEIGGTGAIVAVVGTNVPGAPGIGRANGLGAAMAVRRRFPTVRVVVVSDPPRETELFDALRFGMAAYVGRAMEPEELARVIARVAAGAYVFDESVLARRAPPPPAALPASSPTEARDDVEGITARELEILELIGRGRSNRVIGEELRLGDQSVKNQVATIMRKLGVNDRTQAVVEAIRAGVMKP